MAIAQDLTGQKFGKLFVLDMYKHDSTTYKTYWRCRCECGNDTIVDGKYLRNGDTKSCGKCYKFEDLVGKRYGNLVVISRAENRGNRVYWKCKCDCGNEVEKRTIDLTHGKSTSCGHCKVFMSKTMVGRMFGELTVVDEHDGLCKCKCKCGNGVIRTTAYLLAGKCQTCGHDIKGFHGEDITGNRYGRLIVIGFDKEKSLWECKCSCGNKSSIYLSKFKLRSGDVKSCGCLLHIDKYEDLTNKKYNHLTVIKMVGRDEYNKILWECECDCENHTRIIVPAERLKSGSTKSCGCISIAHSGSEVENSIKDYLHSLSANRFIKKRILDNKEIDMYNDVLKLGIEYNGSIYHATLNGLYDNKPKNYHQQKFLLAKEKGIHLINIFDVDYEQNKEKILAYLGDIIVPSHRLYARQCKLKWVDKHLAWEFYDQYHLQGKSYMSQINYGLYYGDELVAVMGFGKLRMKNAKRVDSYELHRYCVKNSYTIVGGSQKLFTVFIRDYNPKYIKSYSDNDYFLGSMYDKLGFKYCGQANIPYFWVLKNKKVKREQCQVQKLRNLYSDLYTKAVDSGASNKEDFIMQSLGACKIYTAGNSVWEWKCE